ncbi:MAG: dihydrolipoyllysine-residue succinyltransferase [Opitutaceae bacterium]|jgi:2-oxoglutarate dehydrogenase E2 component (dihydrolipoamide succinyltransferase)|nr:dihydrolipoyllysine-residue succinyltransferase [Opitutaceae bacterium]
MSLIEVKIPFLGESITTGILAKWHVADGDTVQKDQPLYELETDKITSEGAAESAGRIALKVPAGAGVKIGALIATIDTAAAAASPATPAAPATVPAALAAASPAKPAAPAAPPAAAAPSTPATWTAGVPPADTAAAAKSPFPASPAVRRLAADTGIDPATIPGTGKAGRVTKADLLAAAAEPVKVEAASSRLDGAAAGSGGPGDPPVGLSDTGDPPEAPNRNADFQACPSAPAPASVPAPEAGLETCATEQAAPHRATPVPPDIAAPAPERETRKKLTPLRQRIAQHLVQARNATAMLTTFNECDMSAVIALRARCQDDFIKRHGVKLGLMSFFTKAVVHALKEVPAINARLDGDTIVENHYYDIGVAVSTEKGLMVPVIRDCDRLGMAGIERAIADTAKRARESRITLADLEGGVFTITNGGIFGSLLSTPVLNSPQSAILGLHAIADRPVARDAQVVIRPMMWLALSYDHRLVDGREAVTFLLKVKQTIEDPARLVLEL